MPQDPSPIRLLEEWRQWTLAEASALRTRDWDQVAAAQQAKQRLRPVPPQAPEKAQPDDAARVRCLVDELVALETANRDWLATQTAGLQTRLSELQGTTRNLARLRSSYAGAHRSHWQSYS
jgi:hypothetical protein